MAKIDAFFKLMFDQGASDLHLTSGQQPILRLHGDMERIKYKVLEDGELKTMLYEIAPEVKIKQFEETGDVDFGYEIPGVARFRCNFFNQKYGCGAVFRQIPTKVSTAQDLGLPPILTRAAMLNKGLVLITGPTGSGKSTTLAAMVDFSNKHRKDHIITIEDPIEFVHQSQSCLVNHREVGMHTKSFSAALRGALREDPDIILVGEMRDLETIRLALEAAETGHLVLATLHTTNAAKTVDRVIEVFPHEEQAQIRTSLSTSLKLVVAQTLLKRIDRKGRCHEKSPDGHADGRDARVARQRVGPELLGGSPAAGAFEWRVGPGLRHPSHREPDPLSDRGPRAQSHAQRPPADPDGPAAGVLRYIVLPDREGPVPHQRLLPAGELFDRHAEAGDTDSIHRRSQAA